MSDDRQELLALVTATRGAIEWWRETGIEAVPGTSGMPLGEVRTLPLGATVPNSSAHPTTVQADGPWLPQQDDTILKAHEISTEDLLTHPGVRTSRSLPDLCAVLGDCQRCKLAPHRTQIVFGVGNPNAELVFVGEAPGRDEDHQGEPFVGRAGQLLTEIIVKGMKLRREDVYIANIIKCRPPQNRNPEPDEIAACEPFLKQQLELIRPKAIVALGTFAAQCLLKTRTPITRLRGVWANYQGVPIMPTFHPAYLLRNPSDKRLVWRDIQQVMIALGLR
jgi:uracil-DNA glycosylase family 4